MKLDRPLGSGDEFEGFGAGGFGAGVRFDGPGSRKQVAEAEAAVAVGPCRIG